MRRSFARYACGLFGIACLAALGLVASAASAQAQTITANGTTSAISIARGDAVTVGAGSGGTAGDWVGLYTVGAPSGSYSDWWYLNGTKSMPGGAVANSSFGIVMTQVPGAYVLRKFHNNGFELLASSGVITVRNPTVNVNGVEAPTHVVSEPRASIQIDVVSGPGERHDWVGIYRIGSADTAWLDWAYLNGLQTLPATGLHTTSFTMTLPIPRGPFELRWFTGSTRLATSATVESEVRTRAAGGDAHTLTVRADGTVWASGLNASGQLGDDSMTTRPRQSRLAG